MNIKLSFIAIMQYLKIALDLRSDKALAEALGLSCNAYANLKKRNAIPYEKVITLALQHNWSLDEIFLTGMNQSNLQQQHHNTSNTLNPESPSQLLVGLTDAQIQFVLLNIEEKKRINRLEEQLSELKQTV